MQKRPLLILAALAAATEPDFGRDAMARLATKVREKHAEDPTGTMLATVLVSSWLFYRAERGHNPKVKTLHDALVYVTSSLSGGYTEIFARTSTGKTIGSMLLTFGPGMAAGLFDERGAGTRNDAGAKAIVERLDRIVDALAARG